MLAAQLFQVLDKLANIRLRADEGIADKVRVLDNELQSFQVIGGECRYVDARLGEVDALFGAEFLAFRTSLRDFDGDGI